MLRQQKINLSKNQQFALIEDDAFNVALEKNFEYYKENFTKIISTEGNEYKFNWSAGIFQCYWFAYRRLYKEASILGLFQILIMTTLSFMFPKSESGAFSFYDLGLFIYLAIMFLIIGNTANVYYFKNVIDKLYRGKTDEIGTDGWAVLILIGSITAIDLFIKYILNLPI